MVELDGEHERTVVAGDQLRIPLQEAVVVHHAGVVLELEALPAVDGIAVHDVVHPDVLDDAALVVVGHIAHGRGQRVHGRECLRKSPLLEEPVVRIVPVQVVLRLPGPGLSAAQDLLPDQLQARRSADGALLAPVDDLVAVLRTAQVFVFADIESVVIDARTAGVVVVPPAVVAEGMVIGHQVRLEAGIGLILRVLPVAGVIDQDTGRIQPVAHRHLLVVLALRGGAALVVHVVDHQRGVTAVAQDHPAEILVAVREIETALQVVIVETVCRVLVAARLLPIEQAELVRPVEHAPLTDGAVEVEHIESQRLGGLDLAARQLVRWHDAVLRPETPGDGSAHHDALAVEVELPVTLHVPHLEPAETEAARVAVLPHLDGQVVQIGLFDAPEPGLGQADVQLADVLARGPFAVPGFAVELRPGTVADAQFERFLRGTVGLHRDLHADGVGIRAVLHENVRYPGPVGRRQLHAAGDAAEAVGRVGAVFAPGIDLRILPVEVAVGIGDAHADDIARAVFQRVGNVKTERGAVDQVIAHQLVVQEHLRPETDGLEVDAHAPPPPVGRDLNRRLEPADSHVVAGHAEGLAVPAPEVFFHRGGQVDAACLRLLQQRPAAGRDAHGKGADIHRREVQFFVLPGRVKVKGDVPVVTRKVKRLALCGKRTQRQERKGGKNKESLHTFLASKSVKIGATPRFKAGGGAENLTYRVQPAITASQLYRAASAELSRCAQPTRAAVSAPGP